MANLPLTELAVVFNRLGQSLQNGELDTFAHLLRVFWHIRGKPYTLDNHAPFEEMFRRKLAVATLYMTGRQVGKTQTMASDGLTKALTIPNFTMLYVAPLFEQIRRFSTQYIGPLLRNSPARHLLLGPHAVDSVLQRSFINGSQMMFSYASRDADRIRGIAAHMVGIDEIQDMDKSLLSVILETLSASTDWALKRFFGTPKTLDNTIEVLWGQSSQAEWFIPCMHCTTGGHPTWNIPSMEFHLERMIGPFRTDISERYPATICHKCGQAISPRLGRWIHRQRDKQWQFAGYHVPQPIMPIHYAYPEKWAELLGKQQGRYGYSTARFWNEVLGTSCDFATKLVSKTELQRTANLGPNTPEYALKCCGRYTMRVLACDWGGGGERGVSWTVVALIGLRADGTIEVPFAKRLMTPNDHTREAREVLHYWQLFKPQVLAHDYTGAGGIRETLLVQAGIPRTRVFPAQYVRSARSAPCYHVAPSPQHPRHHYRVDKARTLLTTCEMVKYGKIKFFDYDYVSDEEPGLIHDFLALVERKMQTMSVGEIYRIDCVDGMHDDFAQAVNIGCTVVWHTRGWPDIAEIAAKAITPEQLESLDPEEAAYDREGDDERFRVELAASHS